MKGSERLPYNEKRLRYRKAAFLAFLLLFLSVIATTLFGDSGILANLGIKAEYSKLLQERDELRAENSQLFKEVRELKTSDRKIEAIGRRDFGFARPGEVVFFFPEDPTEPVQMYRQPEHKEDGGP